MCTTIPGHMHVCSCVCVCRVHALSLSHSPMLLNYRQALRCVCCCCCCYIRKPFNIRGPDGLCVFLLKFLSWYETVALRTVYLYSTMRRIQHLLFFPYHFVVCVCVPLFFFIHRMLTSIEPTTAYDIQLNG